MRSYFKISLMTALILVVAVSIGFTKSSRNNSIAWLGVATMTVDDEFADQHDLPIGFGAIVMRVVEDSPAERAGIREDDIIIAYDNNKVYDANDLTDFVEESQPGDDVTIIVYRNDEKVKLNVKLDEKSSNPRYPSYRNNNNNERLYYTPNSDEDDYYDAQKSYKDAPRFFSKDDLKELKELQRELKRMKMPNMEKGSGIYNLDNFYRQGGNRAYLGVYLDNLNDQLGEYFGVNNGNGALVTEIVDDSPAQKAGLKAGDVIVAVDGEKVNDQSDVVEMIGQYKPDDKVSITYIRNKSKKEINVVLDKNDNKYSSGTIYFNSPDVSVNIPPMDDVHLGYFNKDNDEEEYLDAVDDYIEALEDYQDQIDEANGNISQRLQKKLERYLQKVDQFQKEYDEQYKEEASRKLERAMRKLERESDRLRKYVE